MKDAAKRLVIDASVTLAWLFADEATSESDAILELLEEGSEALVPAIWPLEIANVLLIAERRQRVSPAQVKASLRRLESLPIHVEAADVSRIFDEILDVARQEQLTAYDASYVGLAFRQTLPLATLDAKLRRAAKALDVPLLLS